VDIIKLISGKASTNYSGSRSGNISHTPSGKSVQENHESGEYRSPKKAGKEKNNNNGVKKAVLVTAIVIVVICVSFFVLGAQANGLDAIFPNVSMESVNIGGMSAADAADALIAGDVGTDTDKELTVNLPAGCELKISAKDAGCYMGASDAAAYAYDACHSGSFVDNTFTYIKCIVSGMKLTIGSSVKLDEDYIRNKTDEAAKQVSLALMQSSVTIGTDSISVVKGASTVQISADKLFDAVKSALTSGDFSTIEYKAESSSSGNAAATIDLQSLYNTIYEEPVSAKYDPATQAATAHVSGRSFDITAAQKLWDSAKNGDVVVIPLILTEPAITTDKLNSMLFSDVLAQKSTSLTGSSTARINNIKHATASINGIVLNPGDEFSYNDTLGQRTAAGGYQLAGAYSGGQVVSEIGGGICQVSSTLYYCTLISNLAIVDRTCHYFGVAYLPAGLDATVSWPLPDFKFKNNSEYPIKLEAYVDKKANTVVVKIHGSNPDGIRVEMTTETWNTDDGYGARSYRWVYDKNGALISKKTEATSTYHFHPTPSPSPSLSTSTSASPSSNTAPTAAPSPSAAVTSSPSTSAAHSPSASPTATTSSEHGV